VQTIAVPLWLFVTLIALSTWALLDRMLIPSVRWYLRRRVNRAIDEINTRLNVHIRPFQLTKRQVLIDRLVHDPKVTEALMEHAQARAIPRDVAQAEVLRYAREIVPGFNVYAYFRIGYWLARRIARLLYRVRVGFVDPARLGGVDPRATVVFVMNHRSNMDYILAAFLAAEQSALSYAVGEWARIWPLQQLIRMMGAYFVRRRSESPLYRRVLERYVHMATEEGVCQAVFLEGRLSRDGRLQPPRFGILDYMLRDHDLEAGRDIVFVPVGINFDRVLEDRTLLRSLDVEAPPRSVWFVLRTTLGFILHNLWLMVRSRWQRLGYAAVHFGCPMSVRNYAKARRLDFRSLSVEERRREIEALAQHLMDKVAQLIPALPVPMATSALLGAGPAAVSERDWKAAFFELAEAQHRRGTFVVLPRRTREVTFESAVRMLRLRKLVVEAGDGYRPAPGAQELLAYYANTVITPPLPEAVVHAAAT
jgi:glycerol-3-phosphate O-acyltransferase